MYFMTKYNTIRLTIQSCTKLIEFDRMYCKKKFNMTLLKVYHFLATNVRKI